MIVYGLVWFGQYILNRLVAVRFINPINQFVDLLSMMNVSLFALTNRQ